MPRIINPQDMTPAIKSLRAVAGYVGGVTALAKLIDVKTIQIWNWTKSGTIPSRHIAGLITAGNGYFRAEDFLGITTRGMHRNPANLASRISDFEEESAEKAGMNEKRIEN
jgi:hypothetical protein